MIHYGAIKMCITADAFKSIKEKSLDEDRAIRFMSALINGIDAKFDDINRKLDTLIAISAPNNNLEKSNAA
jgi:hypothetical protein